jgi:hypothetical protein
MRQPTTLRPSRHRGYVLEGAIHVRYADHPRPRTLQTKPGA